MHSKKFRTGTKKYRRQHKKWHPDSLMFGSRITKSIYKDEGFVK